jgi:putative Mg2+ transporter-C (MgtC) family protein
MPLRLHWTDVALRLLLTVVGGTLIGINRGERGRPAGLRTTLLVSLAAALAMIEANMLLSTRGKQPDSFVNFDVMRLPLGILSGMGFIGAGAVVRKGSMVIGLTTAATLWFVTVMGLCYGGGQLGLGTSALALGMAVLWGLRPVEQKTRRDQRATLRLVTGIEGPSDEEVREAVAKEGYAVRAAGQIFSDAAKRRELRYDLAWHALSHDTQAPWFVHKLAASPGVLSLEWTPQTLDTYASDAGG